MELSLLLVADLLLLCCCSLLQVAATISQLKVARSLFFPLPRAFSGRDLWLVLIFP
ncbi:hypothetical protein ASPBRDRAFT_46434 [Aspergillus brasiliensis CBS 101740]|uniref:Uncharacterized protein n=1 Tax=Aspergillus brasiliensis (strain CBS 101740 / IMI 381727 / IBT 21946) TaxID=767769 RepID=A0A1L9UBU7_ASPBC|nr:hypothetical protein ASPBRDRAFT_46434 [Aspergillus brasiliensis CBS 101740]